MFTFNNLIYKGTMDLKHTFLQKDTSQYPLPECLDLQSTLLHSSHLLMYTLRDLFWGFLPSIQEIQK